MSLADWYGPWFLVALGHVEPRSDEYGHGPRMEAGLFCHRMKKFGANLAAAGFGEACKQQGILVGKAAGLLRARGKRT